jgi:hypothetical protein
MKKILTLGIVVVMLLACVGAVSAGDLITNGGFESPINTQNWQVYPDGYSGLYWTIEQGIGPLSEPTLEYQTSGTLGPTPAGGDQYAELDSYANVNISQMVTLTKGITYHISFAQTCRPQESGATSILGVYLDGELLSRTACDQTLTWKTNTVDVTPAADVTAKLMFADEGLTTQSYGVLLDDVKMEYEENHEVPVPEFPTVAFPAALIVGLIGAILLIQKSKEN